MTPRDNQIRSRQNLLLGYSLEQRKSHLVKNFADIFTEICGIGFYWYNKYASELSEKSLEQKSITKSHSKFSCQIVLELQK